MGISIRWRAASLAAGFALAVSLTATDVYARDVKTITEVEVQEEDGVTQILLRGAEDPIYTAFLRDDPPRLIVELPDVTFDGIETPLHVANGLVKDVALAAFGDPRVSPSMARISIGLQNEAEYEILPNGNQLRIEIRPLAGQAEPTVIAKSEPPSTVVARAQPKPAPKTAASSKSGASRIIGLMAEGEQVQVIADGPLDSVDAFRLSNPDRVVIDFWGTKNAVFPTKFGVDSGAIQQVRIGEHSDKVRVVMDLRAPIASHSVETSENGVLILLSGEGSSSITQVADQGSSSIAQVGGQGWEEREDDMALEPVPAAPDKAFDPVKSKKTSTNPYTAPEGDSVWVNSVHFESLPSVDRVVLSISGEVQAVIAYPDPITVVVDFPGSRIPPETQRRVDTTEFGGPLEMFSVFQTPDISYDQVRVVLKRRGNLKPRLNWDDGNLKIEFPRAAGSAVAPPVKVPGGVGFVQAHESGVPAQMAAQLDDSYAPMMGPPPAAAGQAPGTTYPVRVPGARFPSHPGAGAFSGPPPALPFGQDPLLAGPADPAAIDILEEGGFDDEKTYQGRRISLDFKDADIANILRLIAEVSDLNIIAGEEVEGKVTIRLVDVPWDQAMDVILLTKGLGFVRVGNVLRIAPLETLKTEKEARLMERRSKEKLEDLVVKLQPVNYADPSEMRDLVQRLLSARGSVNVDKRTSTLIIKDIPSVIHEATALVKAIDTQTPQVVIEAKIVEASLNFSRALGANWGIGFNQGSGSTGGGSGLHLADGTLDALIPVPDGDQQSNFISSNPVVGILNGALRLGLLGNDERIQLDLELMAAESNNRGKVISAPRVVTLDNREAVIKQGVAIKFTEITRDTVTTSFVDAVLELRVTPHITANRSIIMKLKVSRNAPQLSSASGDVVGIAKNETETEALVRDGETMVLGGIYVVDNGKSTSKFPYLADIPFLGTIFRGVSIQDERRELLIFVTPRIVTSPSSDV